MPFTAQFVGGEEDRAALAQLWPPASIPVLVNGEFLVPESTTIVEHLDGIGDAPPLIPADAALQARLWDRVIDGQVMTPMQKIVLDALRPEDAHDAYGVAEARAALDHAYALLDDHLAHRDWLAGTRFTVADCAAAPALHYAYVVHRWPDRPNLTRYLDALLARPAVARVVDEARVYREVFPLPWPADVA